jgi:hypothetical protein
VEKLATNGKFDVMTVTGSTMRALGFGQQEIDAAMKPGGYENAGSLYVIKPETEPRYNPRG